MPSQIRVVLFTDQIESTARTRERTHDEMRRVSDDQEALTRWAAARCGGKVVKDTGDGHMILFDACSHAVRCGALIQQEAVRRNQAQPNEWLRFDLHVGIDFGEVVEIPSGDLRGNAPNLAARIGGPCPAGEVYFSEAVRNELGAREAPSEQVDLMTMKGLPQPVPVYRLVEWRGAPEEPENPFTCRDGIRRASDFFSREAEQRRIRLYLQNGQNCSVVGPRRIGKTSLLLQVQRMALRWREGALPIYVDLQDPQCATLPGLLALILGTLDPGASTPPTLVRFSRTVEAVLASGRFPLLCLDELERLAAHPDEFTEEFLLALRAFSQKGVSFVTASKDPLHRILDSGRQSSAWFNVFPHLDLDRFTTDQALDFLARYRTGVPTFTPEERSAILEFARQHPLGLQTACFHVLEARPRGTGATSPLALSRALSAAEGEMQGYLPSGW